MKTTSFLLPLLLLGSFASPLLGGPTGYPERDVRPIDCRYGSRHVVPSLAYRQYEDSRRFNAAPCLPPAALPASVYHRPRIIRCEEVCRERKTRHFIDQKGNRYTTEDVIIVYREIWSDGRCRIRKRTVRAGDYPGTGTGK